MENRTATKVIAVSIVMLAVVWGGIFFLQLVVPYDYQTADYPEYLESIRAAKYNLACLFNPFNDGGVVSDNLIANFDPLEWLPAIFSRLPNYQVLESFYVLHLALVPIGLVLVARAHDVPKSRWIYIVFLSMMAYALGPTLKYMQQTNAIGAMGLTVFALGALEWFRKSGKSAYVVAAGLALAYSVEHWIYAAVFLPLVLLAYGITHFSELTATRTRVASICIATGIGLIVVLPSVLLDLKYNQTIAISENFNQLTELFPSDLLAMMGAPLDALHLVMIPTALITMVVLGFRSSQRFERLIFLALMLALVAYSFGDITPFGNFFRKIYPIAGVIRRPYAAWYVLIPLMLVIAVRGLRLIDATIVRGTCAVGALAVLGSLAVTSSINRADSVAGGVIPDVILLGSLAAMVYRPRFSVVFAAAMLQWLVLDQVPFWNSQWRPIVIPASNQYLQPYESVRGFLPFESNSSSDAYRIANIGLPAEFGVSSGAWDIYGIAADYNTSTPRNLAKILNPAPLHAAILPDYVRANPEFLATTSWQRMAVRYYLIGPTVIDSLRPMIKRHPNLRLTDVQSYWSVIEDRAAAPFVSSVFGNVVRPLKTQMTRDSFRFRAPKIAAEVRLAILYDSWWKATDQTGRDLSSRLFNKNGQLAFNVVAIGGQDIRLHYTNSVVVAAIWVSLFVQLALATFFTFVFVLRRLGKFSGSAIFR